VTIFRIESTSAELMAESRRRSGVDIVDNEIEEALERLLWSLDNESALHRDGAIAMRERLLRVLCNRLRIKRDYARYPEIDRIVLKDPLFLTGAGRTGSTKLHKLLAASGDFIWLRFWQGHAPGTITGRRAEDPSERIIETEAYIRWWNEHAPEARLIHPFGTFDVEEEVLFLEHALFGAYIQAFVFVPSFMQWFATQGFKGQVEYIRQGLKYVHWQFHEGDARPWLLKCPVWPGYEPLLAEVFPGARFVTTNRHPLDSISSVASLLHHYHKGYSNADRRELLGDVMVAALGVQMDTFLDQRDQHPELPTLDIAYSDLMRNEDQVVERIYAFAGMPLTAAARTAMRDWNAANAQHKLGVHKHSLEEYGLREDAVKRAYARYIERFANCF
jgi:Sulfotransferase family